jgi:MEDS: MEthanogen/methylotroph, DcmR Sensory domain
LYSHTCQLFDSEETRAEAAAAFLAEGFLSDEHMIVVVRPGRWALIVEALKARGLSADEPIAEGRLIVKDAVTTLAQICSRGRLNAFAFNAVMGAAVEGLKGRRLRAYGEMVDILAERGDFDDVLELEELWNNLGEVLPLSLRCAYSAAHFVAVSTHRSLREICLAHTDVHRNPQDTLASWVLTTAHHSSGPFSLH